MKELIVKIKYDEDIVGDVNAQDIKDCFDSLCFDYIDVTEINPEFPTDKEINTLTQMDADNRMVLNYVGHDQIMKKGIEHGISLSLGNPILKKYEYGKLKFEDLYVGMELNNIDLGSTPQSFKIVEIDYNEKSIVVENHKGIEEWNYELIKFALGLDK